MNVGEVLLVYRNRGEQGWKETGGQIEESCDYHPKGYGLHLSGNDE